MLHITTIAFLFAALAAALVAGKGDLEKITHKVFFDVEMDGEPAGRVVMGLFGGSCRERFIFVINIVQYLMQSSFVISTRHFFFNCQCPHTHMNTYMMHNFTHNCIYTQTLFNPND